MPLHNFPEEFMVWKDEDSEDNFESWEDPTDGDGWKGEEIDENDVAVGGKDYMEPWEDGEQEEYIEEVARTLSREEFLALRLWFDDLSDAEIARRLQWPVSQVQETISKAQQLALDYFDDATEQNLPEILYDMSQLGYRNDCFSCDIRMQGDDRFCPHCGAPNAYFNEETFLIMYAIPVADVEDLVCPLEHPETGEGDGFCHACGKNLQNTNTDPS